MNCDGFHGENLVASSNGYIRGSQVSAEIKGKKRSKKVTYELVEYHKLPGYLRDNDFIIGHYRAEWPLKQVFLSIFAIHNETLNVWTHLIGFFIFLALTICTAMKIPKMHSKLMACCSSIPNMSDMQDEVKTSFPSMNKHPSSSDWQLPIFADGLPQQFSHNFADACVLQCVKEEMANTSASSLVRPITRWPFFAFLCGAMFCLLASSTCHLLSCHSKRLAYIMLRVDYAGIAALISASFYPLVYYSFMCIPFFCNLYLGFITLLGIATVIFSLLPFFQKPEYRTLRTTLFSGMGVSGVAPIIHKLVLFRHQPEALHTTVYEVLMGAFYGLGTLIYATRIPERWKPGKFDIAGHSHQLFHVLVVAGAYTHYRAGLVYLKWRDMEGC